MNPVIDLGFISIHLYSVFLFFAMLTAYFIITKEAKKQNINEEIITNLIFYTIIYGIIGARMYFVIFHLDYYINDPIRILKVWEGGLAIHGGIIAGIIFIYFYCKKNNLNILKTLDIIVVGLIIAQAIGRWGNFFNGEAHGPETTLNTLENMYLPDFIINGMYIGGTYYIPTFLFESVLCLLGFIILLILRKKTKKTGILTSFYLIYYAVIRFFIESLRTDSLMFFDFKAAQVVSIIMIIIGIIILIRKEKCNV